MGETVERLRRDLSALRTQRADLKEQLAAKEAEIQQLRAALQHESDVHAERIRQLADTERELDFARTMAPPNVFGAHTMAGLLSDAAEWKQRAEAAEQQARSFLEKADENYRKWSESEDENDRLRLRLFAAERRCGELREAVLAKAKREIVKDDFAYDRLVDFIESFLAAPSAGSGTEARS